MATARLWAFGTPTAAALAQTALDLLGRADMANSFLGRFPPQSPQLHYAGWQTDPTLLTLLEGALGTVVGLHLFRGALYGQDTESSANVVQESQVTGAEATNPALRYSRRACLKLVYARLLLGAPPADVTASASQESKTV